eukprot:CAMPEP_0181244858 /NCGR_PEP_ID=MMETSP1096-20121128/43098_1 /TAXON_ID=156174 ORGANISM="Chrysochromulina ericina, Strain CCMP281" /NCGR_SAMPLE_ID=MMETSP1096 /ASSEMBLY_ACC=CAM_ASM_000453 /LENGTH=43 /DNA_ID= /DNA_START= /DNA_END= /DNA_ORIENTATION=
MAAPRAEANLRVSISSATPDRSKLITALKAVCTWVSAHALHVA